MDSVAGDSDLRTGVPKAQAVAGVNDRFSFFDFSGCFASGDVGVFIPSVPLGDVTVFLLSILRAGEDLKGDLRGLAGATRGHTWKTDMESHDSLSMAVLLLLAKEECVGVSNRLTMKFSIGLRYMRWARSGECVIAAVEAESLLLIGESTCLCRLIVEDDSLSQASLPDPDTKAPPQDHRFCFCSSC